MKKIIISLFLATLACAVNAKPIEVQVNLLSLKMLQASEKNGDELYLHVTEYSTKNKSKAYTVPKLPMYWPSSSLDKVNNVNVWSGKLDDNEGINVIISLMEQDAPPWNPDDLMGTAKLNLKNHDGHLSYTWSMPNTSEVPEIVVTKYGEARKYDVGESGGHYEMYFLTKIK